MRPDEADDPLRCPLPTGADAGVLGVSTGGNMSNSSGTMLVGDAVSGESTKSVAPSTVVLMGGGRGGTGGVISVDMRGCEEARVRLFDDRLLFLEASRQPKRPRSRALSTLPATVVALARLPCSSALADPSNVLLAAESTRFNESQRRWHAGFGEPSATAMGDTAMSGTAAVVFALRRASHGRLRCVVGRLKGSDPDGSGDAG